MDEELTERQEAIINMLWDYLKKVPKHRLKQRGLQGPRVETAWGSKTKIGLARSIESLFDK